jgi:hypothetical protein
MPQTERRFPPPWTVNAVLYRQKTDAWPKAGVSAAAFLFFVANGQH